MTTITMDPEMGEINLQEDLHYPELVDAQKMAKDNPETFEVATEKYLRKNLKLGDLVKVCDKEERIWVIIRGFIEDDGDKWMIGEVNNFLMYAGDYNINDLVVFEYRNIYATCD